MKLKENKDFIFLVETIRKRLAASKTHHFVEDSDNHTAEGTIRWYYCTECGTSGYQRWNDEMGEWTEDILPYDSEDTCREVIIKNIIE